MTDTNDSTGENTANRRTILQGMAAATAAGLGVVGTAAADDDVEAQLCCCPEVQCCTSACDELCVACPCGIYNCQ